MDREITANKCAYYALIQNIIIIIIIYVQYCVYFGEWKSDITSLESTMSKF